MKAKRLAPLVLLLLAATATVHAQFTYRTNADGTTLTITGWSGSGIANIPDIINGRPVVSIADGAFALEETLFPPTNLTSVTIPGSVTNLGSNAFAFCVYLTNVTMSNGITCIGPGAFYDCEALAGFTIPDSVTTIGEYAFVDCWALTALTIPGSVSSMGDYAFEQCRGLTNLTLANGVRSIGNWAFVSCWFLNSVTIPNSVTSIPPEAFRACNDLTSVRIPGSVTNIGEAAFGQCISLANVTIGNGVTSLGDWAFWSCSNLSSVYFSGNAPIADSTVFTNINATAYYLPNTTGWDKFSASTGFPVVLWNPKIQSGDGSFGLKNNQFGFNITGTNNYTVVVEVCTNLASSVWVPLTTNALRNGVFHFSEPAQTNVSARFFGLGWP